MEKTVIKQNIEKSDVSINNIEFLAETDLSFLKNYTDFVYNVTFYKGNKAVCASKRNINVIVKDKKILVKFDGFENKSYSRAVISSITAFKDNEELTIKLEHEITITFHN